MSNAAVPFSAPSAEALRGLYAAIEARPDCPVFVGAGEGMFWYCTVLDGVITGWTVEACADPAKRFELFQREAQAAAAYASRVAEPESATAAKH